MTDTTAATRLGDAHRPLREQATDELRMRIVEGRLGPGDRLVETQLADELGVSRNPVREALRVLEAEGFVVTVPRRGMVVVGLDEAAVNDLFDIRVSLEGYASGAAAERVARGLADVGPLQRVLAQARAATERDDLVEVSRCNSAFHTRIVEMSGNALLAGIIRPLMWRVRWVFQLSAHRRAPHSWTEHVAILDAVAAGDAELARRLGADHAERAREAALSAVRGAADRG